MNKRLLLKVFLLCLLFCQLVNRANAQYAVGGEAPLKLQRSVYWLTWAPYTNPTTGATNVYGLTVPTGGNASTIVADQDYIWEYSPTTRITARISGLSVTEGTATKISPYTPGGWVGDGLDVLYNGNGITTAKSGGNNPLSNSRGVPNSAIAINNNGKAVFNITITVEIKINGTWTPVNYPGMVIADGEAIAYGSTTAGKETIEATTNATTNWQMLDYRVDAAKAATKTQTDYTLDLTNGGKTMKLYARTAAGSDAGVQAVMYAHGATGFTNVTMKGYATTAIAIGFILPFDRGDALVSYGKAESYINQFAFSNQPLPVQTGLIVKNQPKVTATAVAKTYIGAANIDPDGDFTLAVGAARDNTVSTTLNYEENDDEDALSASAISAINVKVNQQNDVHVTIPSVTNNEGVPVYLNGWIDFNQNGRFDKEEKSTQVTIPASPTTTTNIDVVFPQSSWGSSVVMGSNTYARFRVSQDVLLDDNTTDGDERATTATSDGEVEDYKLPDITGVTISGNVYRDADGAVAPGGTLSTTTPIYNPGGFQLYAYLAKASDNVLLQRATLGTDGSYVFANPVNNGNYKVAISTSGTATINGTTTLSAVTGLLTLPSGWTASVDTYGQNNWQTANLGIEAGTAGVADLIVPVTPAISGAGTNVTNVNFGIDTNPVAVTDGPVATNTNTATIADVTANDTDSDGNATINKTKVLIETAPNSGSFTQGPITRTGIGVFTLDNTTGVISFTSAGETVDDVAIRYTVKDNFGAVSDPGTVTFRVKIGGQPDPISTNVNTPVPYNVKANDGDAANTGTVTVTPQTGLTGKGGTAIIDTDPTKVKYTPANNFAGVDTYTYTLTKNNATSAPITVTITVKPKGVADAVSTVVNTPVPTVVTSNDGPSGVMTVTVTKATDPLHGSIAVSGTTITYTPNTGYIGTDSFTYTLTKNTIVSDPITVSVTVTPPVPVGVNDNDLTPVNTPVTTDVIANDGTDGIGATVVSTAGSHGATTVSGGNVTYTPANGYIGTDTYTYTLTKNSVTSAPITVIINVYSATMSLSKVANNGGTKAGDVINYTLIVKNTGTVALTNIMLTDAGADAGSISPASIATLAPGASTTITANHTVVAADVTAGKFSNQATATAKDPKNNPVSKISDDPSTTVFDDPTVVPIVPLAPASVNLAKTGVFSGNQVSYTFIITNNGGVPLNTITLTDAKLGLNGVTITAPVGGLLPNASLTYNAVYTLTQADKDAGVVNNTATVNAKDQFNNTITGTGSTVTTVPTSPVAANDAAETNSGTPVIVSVLTNDDSKSSTFNLTTLEIVGNPMHGTVVANANGTVTYTPTAGYNGTDSFTYRVKDAYGYTTNTATVTITTNLIKELKIPTLFSPNGDGVNDGFVIKDLADYAQNELIVLNRWGNEVYRQANYQNTWSGTGLNEGTYFYIVRLKKANGDSWVIKKGYVTLIRTFKK